MCQADSGSFFGNDFITLENGMHPCPRFPNGQPQQHKNAGCAAKGFSFGGGVNAIGFLMVNIVLLDYPLHGGRETRELGPKKCRTLGGAHPSLLQLTFPIYS